MRTNGSQRPMLRLVGDGVGESGDVSLNCGAKSLPSTISSAISKDHQLSESLSYLEREVETLESRFYEACVTLNIVMERLVRLGIIGTRLEAHTTKEQEC